MSFGFIKILLDNPCLYTAEISVVSLNFRDGFASFRPTLLPRLQQHIHRGGWGELGNVVLSAPGLSILREALHRGLLVKNGRQAAVNRRPVATRVEECDLSYGTAYYGLETDRALFEIGGAGVGGSKCATGHGADRAGGKDTVCAG